MPASTHVADNSLSGFTLCTMLGKWPLRHPWIKPCIESWNLIQGTNSPKVVISDGSLAMEDLTAAGLDSELSFDPSGESVVAETLQRFPYLRQMRDKDLTWRKIVDVTIVNKHATKILLIDTDVLVRQKVRLPNQPPIVYLREDIPAYQASPMLPWHYPMVKSFNAGFVLYDPSIIDFGVLDRLCKNYFLSLKNVWWSEQSAWSVIAGLQSERYIWSGKDACTISGFTTRDETQIANNEVFLFSKKGIASREELMAQSGASAVIHMPALAKQNWDCFELRNETGADTRILSVVPDDPINLFWKAAISLRLLTKIIKG